MWGSAPSMRSATLRRSWLTPSTRSLPRGYRRRRRPSHRHRRIVTKEHDMPLHRLTRLTIGVPNLDETASFYTDFGLTPIEPADGEGVRRFATADGGEQLRLVHRPIRQLVEIGIGAGDADDLDRIAAALSGIDVDSHVTDDGLHVVEPATGIAVT